MASTFTVKQWFGKESEMPSYAEAMAERRAILQAGGFGGEMCGEV